MSSRKRITRTSLGLRLVSIQFFKGHTDTGSELLGSEEESEESDTVLDKEGNSENDIVIADLEKQSIMTGRAGPRLR